MSQSDQFRNHMATILAEATAGKLKTRADVDRRRNELIQSPAVTATAQQVEEPAAKLKEPAAKPNTSPTPACSPDVPTEFETTQADEAVWLNIFG